ncbi:MAG: transposase [Anaerolineales bacterium]|nr:transposase [Anaerolineales bacterium]MDW8328196.1 transposase [Anaerolineales bacterium]
MKIEQIAAELDLAAGDAQQMTTRLHEGIVAEKKPTRLSGKVEAVEVHVVAGHKGHPKIVQKLGRQDRRRRLQGARGRGTLAREKPPIPGLFQRNGDVVLQMLPNVQQAMIQPSITRTVTPGSRLYTDEYSSYRRLAEWGYEHKTVNHARGE